MKILAVDYGDARTGIAICDKSEMLASPVCVIKHWDIAEVAKQVVELATEHRAEKIIIGNPLNMDGSAGARSQLCHAFAEKTAELCDITIKMWDERSTTVSATHYLNTTDTRGKKRKEVVDAVAATIILESYLNYRKNHPDD